MWGKCPARHVKTYIHPATLGLTDIVKINERFEDAPIGEITERKLAQGIVDWNSCLVFDIMFCGVSSRIKYSNKFEGVCLHLTYIHVPPSVPSQFLAKRHLLETQSWICRWWRGTPDCCFLKIVIFIFGRCISKMSSEIFSERTRDKSADHNWWHHMIGQIPQDGENEQNVSLFLFLMLCCDPTVWFFSSFLNCTEEILSLTV